MSATNRLNRKDTGWRTRALHQHKYASKQPLQITRYWILIRDITQVYAKVTGSGEIPSLAAHAYAVDIYLALFSRLGTRLVWNATEDVLHMSLNIYEQKLCQREDAEDKNDILVITPNSSILWSSSFTFFMTWTVTLCGTDRVRVWLFPDANCVVSIKFSKS